MTHRYIALLLVLTIGPGFREDDLGQLAPCDHLATPDGIQIDTLRIGPFPLRAPLDSLRRLCPNARPTVGYGFETEWAALDVSVGQLTILAGQNTQMRPLADAPDVPAPVVDWSRPPSHWVVSGCGAMLPGGVSSCGTWAELVSTFGARGTGNAEFGPVVVTFDELSGFSFRFDVTNETVGSIEVHQDLSRIPGSARIVDVFIMRSPRGAA